MLASWIWFAIVYNLQIEKIGEFSERTYFVFLHSLKNVVPLFTSLFRFGSRPEKYQSSYDKFYKSLKGHGVDVDMILSIGFVQQLMGVIFLFLFLLALRNKFRLK